MNFLTPISFTYVNELLQQLESVFSFPFDQLRFISCLIVAYPLAYVHSQIRSVTLKHLINTVLGITLAQFVYQSDWLHSLFSALVTYTLMQTISPKYACTIVFVFNMAFLAYLHLSRMYRNYMGWDMDSTSSQMILVIKLTSFAYNYYDGQVIDNDDDVIGNVKLLKTKRTRAMLAIQEMPSLLEFLGYVYCFPTFLVGPCFEFRVYKNAMEGTDFLQHGKRMPSNLIIPALQKAFTGIFFMAIVAVFGKYGDLYTVLTHDTPFLVKVIRVYLAILLIRCKYYCAWKLAEGATLLAGAGFEGRDENGQVIGYNGVSNIDIIAFETASNVRDLTRTWNKGTQLWLERYVYNRHNDSLFLTYLCSAIWHGFYPGYYLFFLSVPLATAINRLSRRYIRPYFLDKDGRNGPLKAVYDCVGTIATAISINYLAVSFVLLSWERSTAAYKSLYFSGHIAMIVIYLFLFLVSVRSKKVKQI